MNGGPSHVVTLVVALLLAVAAAWAGYRADVGRAPIHLFASVLALVVCYLPFLIFLMFTYFRALAGMFENEEPLTTVHARAERYMAAGQYHKAVRAYRAELRADPGDVEARLKMARALVELGDLEEAVRTLRVAIPQLDDDHERQIQTVFRLADILANMMGQYKDAAKELDFIRKRFPGTPHAGLAQKRIVQYMARAQ